MCAVLAPTISGKHHRKMAVLNYTTLDSKCHLEKRENVAQKRKNQWSVPRSKSEEHGVAKVAR